MTAVFTPWGYSVSALPALMDEAQFHAYTGNRYADTPAAQLSAAINAATAAVRNVCGWHVAPSIECEAVLTAGDELTGERTRVLALPASYVSGIYSITEGGAELGAGEFAALKNGLIRRTCFKAWSNAWGAIAVDYQAGYDLDAVPDFVGAVVHVIEAALSVPTGVSSETAGGVSISYSQNVSNVAMVAAQQMGAALSPYKVVRAHAA